MASNTPGSVKKWIRSMLFAVLLSGSISGVATAASYDVKATIPYDPSTQPAVFDPGQDGTTVDKALYTITGTCQLMNPQAAVSIWRAGTAIGSAACTGSFSLQIMLQEGANTLVARTANASSIYGPDSAPITITLVLPPPPQPPTDNPIEPVTPQQEQTGTNYAAQEDLTLVPTQPFSVLTSSNEVTITVTVGGGQNPYDIVINWGDGSVDTHHVETAGSYAYSHQYIAPGTYKVHGRVHDVLGAYSEFDYSVLSGQKYTSPASNKGTPAMSSWWTWRHLKPVFIIVAVLVLFCVGYWLGLHQAVSRAVKRRVPVRRTKRIVPATKKRRR